MESLFLHLANLSINAGWLILAVIVLRLVLRRAPRWSICLLWGLVAMRLVCPFTVESAVSLIPSAQTLPADIVYTASPAIDSGVPPIDNIINPILGAVLTPSTPLNSANPTQIWSFILSCIWVTGMVLMISYALVSYLLLRRRISTATLLRDNIKQSERVTSPFVLGLFRPTIYLPYSMTEDDMTHVISHEYAHIHRGDHWWKLIGFLLLAVYWFNPLVWVAYVLFCRDMELACDEKAVANMDSTDRQAYSTALLHCSVRSRALAACPIAFGEIGVKSRVKNVMNYRKPAFWIVLLALVVCIAAGVCFLTVPADDTPHFEDVTGLSAPEGGRDPYARLAPAERAAAFLKNADALSYEFTPILMHGTYVIPVMEYVPTTMPGTSFAPLDQTEMILSALHDFDLTALEPLDINSFQTMDGRYSGVIHAGKARCRVTIWYDYVSTNSILMFTFSDGTVCLFDAGTNIEKAMGIFNAIDMAGVGRIHSMMPYSDGNMAMDGNITVTQLSTGESRIMQSAACAYVECIFDNTVRLATPVKNVEGQFDWQVSIEGGATYLFDAEQLLIQTENGRVYPIGGFADQSDSSVLPGMEQMIRSFVVF